MLAVATVLAVNGRHASAYTVAGQGAQTCGKWTHDRGRNGTDSEITEAWVLGFLSALNQGHPGTDIFLNVDNAGIFSWMDSYCSEHPLDVIADAATRLEQYLEKQKP